MSQVEDRERGGVPKESARVQCIILGHKSHKHSPFSWREREQDAVVFSLKRRGHKSRLIRSEVNGIRRLSRTSCHVFRRRDFPLNPG